ncbi:hypothetical protein JOL62DRAFT_605304 [Phyllosticta paracitricarpa]|uniref:F-box domain-containing protein n=1 Tax=Phyllosticta paracitricarpa TaxID=2016321 RepID=A0ABR1N1J5_9PEZI
MASCDKVPPQLPESTDFGPARPTLLSFPQELLDMILSHLSNDTVKSLRLTSKNFVAGANALLFQDLRVALPYDCDRAFEISKNSEIARCVKQLTLIRLPILPDELLAFDHFLPHCQERLVTRRNRAVLQCI